MTAQCQSGAFLGMRFRFDVFVDPNGWLGGGFKCFLFSPLLGQIIQFD